MGGPAGPGPDPAVALAASSGALALHGAHLFDGGHRDADGDRGSSFQGLSKHLRIFNRTFIRTVIRARIQAAHHAETNGPSLQNLTDPYL